MSEPTKFLLDESAIPTHLVNLLPDLPEFSEEDLQSALAGLPANAPAIA